MLYVRGHLLHDYPGGAGIDFNEAILTAAVRGDFGANHANWVHRYLVEGQLRAYPEVGGKNDNNKLSDLKQFLFASGPSIGAISAASGTRTLISWIKRINNA